MPAPLARLPRRVPGSIRRTAVIDIVADATLEGGHRLSGRACDVRTEANRSWPVADAVIAARVDAAAVLTDLSTPGLPALSGALRGRDARRGFRAAVAEALHAADAHASLEALMLDDLPGMSIISGYARLQRSPADAAAVRRPVIGTCSGWRTGGTAEVTADAGFVGLLDRPAAPSIDRKSVV